MRLLFKIDTRDYDTNGNAFTRPSSSVTEKSEWYTARSIITISSQAEGSSLENHRLRP